MFWSFAFYSEPGAASPGVSCKCECEKYAPSTKDVGVSQTVSGIDLECGLRRKVLGGAVRGRGGGEGARAGAALRRTAAGRAPGGTRGPMTGVSWGESLDW